MNQKVQTVYNSFIELNYGNIQESKLIFSLNDVQEYIESRYYGNANSTIARKIYEHKKEYLEIAGVKDNNTPNDQDILIIKNKLPFLADFDSELFEAINRLIETKDVKVKEKVVYKDYHLVPLYIFVILGTIFGILL